MHIPDWFRKSLSHIDNSWFIEFDDNDGTYSIVKNVSVAVPLEDGRTAVFHGPRTVALFEGPPKERDLDELRRRKKWGEEMKIVENPRNEMMYYWRLNNEAKEKKSNLAVEMMAEGFMKMHKMATTETFVMPGEDKWRTTSQPIPDSGASTPPETSKPPETSSE